MMRKGRMGMGRGLGLAALAAGVVFFGGCGEQDLYRPPHSPWQIAGRVALESSPQDVTVVGDFAFVAGGEAGLIVIDISDPANPAVISMHDTTKFAEAIKVASVPAGDSVIEVAFVVEGTEGITTFDITDPLNIISFQQGTTAVDGNGLFIEISEDPDVPYVVYLAENWKGIRIFESDLNVPGLLRYNGVFAGTRGYAKSIAVQNGYAYVADNEMGLCVVDVRERVLGRVKTVSFCDTDGRAQGVAVDGGFAFVADGVNGLVVMSIDGGETPVIVSRLALPGDCLAIVERDQIAFLAAKDGGIHTVGVSDPINPVHLGTVKTSYANGIGISGDGVLVVSDRDQGIIVLTGGGGFQDKTPPGKVTDLEAAPVDSTSIRLAWTAPGNDLFRGTAAEYDIRYSRSEIDALSWEDATPVEDAPAPSRAGTEETHRVRGLEPDVEYFFALRTADEVSNWSALSNVASAVTAAGNVPPVLSNPGVEPLAGGPDQLFTFSVTYADAEGDVPSRADVVIDGTPWAMALSSGDPETGARYVYQTTLPAGGHEHFFAFNDGHGNQAATAVVPGPYIGILFRMGSPLDELGRDTDETLHTVVLTREVEFSPYEVTQQEYEELMGTNPSRHTGPNRPVENVTWFDAVAYCNALSQREGLAPAYEIRGTTVTWDREADGWRLPTEAEWERACRAGTETAFMNGDLTWPTCLDPLGAPDPVADAVAWFCGNAGTSHREVGQKLANAWGLHDMHGNVWEWCWDWYVAELGTGVALDPQGPPGGSQRVIRGGSWYYFARECRSASRAPYWPNSADDIVGFRVVRYATE